MTQSKERYGLVESRGLVPKCLEAVSDPFLLVVLAARRAQDLSSGSQSTMEFCGHKEAVTALREIALKKIDTDVLRESVVEGFQNSYFSI